MSVDIFGASRGGKASASRGKRGPPGKPGSIRDLCKWLPKTTLATLRKHEENGCFILQSDDDIKMSGKTIEIWIAYTSAKLFKSREIFYFR